MRLLIVMDKNYVVLKTKLVHCELFSLMLPLHRAIRVGDEYWAFTLPVLRAVTGGSTRVICVRSHRSAEITLIYGRTFSGLTFMHRFEMFRPKWIMFNDIMQNGGSMHWSGLCVSSQRFVLNDSVRAAFREQYKLSLPRHHHVSYHQHS